MLVLGENAVTKKDGQIVVSTDGLVDANPIPFHDEPCDVEHLFNWMTRRG
jgi:hypothetical protein